MKKYIILCLFALSLIGCTISQEDTCDKDLIEGVCCYDTDMNGICDLQELDSLVIQERKLTDGQQIDESKIDELYSLASQINDIDEEDEISLEAGVKLASDGVLLANSLEVSSDFFTISKTYFEYLLQRKKVDVLLDAYDITALANAASTCPCNCAQQYSLIETQMAEIQTEYVTLLSYSLGFDQEYYVYLTNEFAVIDSYLPSLVDSNCASHEQTYNDFVVEYNAIEQVPIEEFYTSVQKRFVVPKQLAYERLLQI